jgi:hypothetical protein
MFAWPPDSETRNAAPLSTQAIAYVVEMAAALDRAGRPQRGRVDFIRSFLRVFCDSPFDNRRGLSGEITAILNGYESLSWRTRAAVDKLRPAVKRDLVRKWGRMFS